MWLKRILPSNTGEQLYEYDHGNGYGYTGGYNRGQGGGFGGWYGDGMHRPYPYPYYADKPSRDRGLVSPHSNVADFLLDHAARLLCFRTRFGDARDSLLAIHHALP